MIIPAPIRIASCDCGHVFHAGFRIELDIRRIRYLVKESELVGHDGKGHEMHWLKDGMVTFV